MTLKPKTNISDLFDEAKRRNSYLKVCAPMVRYSKLEFRTLVRKYGVDLCFTPMILTDSFCQSEKARQIEFSTNVNDTPLIGQFAANNLHEYISSAEMVFPYVDGVDLNCGCPQRWAMQSGYGCAMLESPELIKDLTATVRRSMPNSFSVSVKTRIQKDLKRTIDLCRQLEHCGATFITLHGRTPTDKIKCPSNLNALRDVKQSISIPLIVNGDCKSLNDADAFQNQTKCDGVMAARAILTNPTLFSGKYDTTPIECIQDWIDIGNASGENIIFQNFHHHFTFMLEKCMKKRERVVYNDLTKKEQVFEYIEQSYGLRPRIIDWEKNINCTYDDEKYQKRINDIKLINKQKSISNYNADATKGKYFLSKIGDNDDSNSESDGDSAIFDACNMFGDEF